MYTELLFHFFPLPSSLFFRFFLISRITGAGGEVRRLEREEERGKFGKERRVGGVVIKVGCVNH